MTKRPGFLHTLPPVFLAALLGLGACTGDLTDAEYLQRARESESRGDLRAGTIDLKNALRRNPNNHEARRLLGRLLVRLGEAPAAEKVLQPLVELKQPGDPGLIELGRAWLLQNEPRRLLTQIPATEAFALADRVQLHTLRGQAYSDLGELEAAREELQLALQLQPDSVSALIGLARLNGALGRFLEMKEAIDRLLVLAPASGEVWSLQGDLHFYQNELAAAEEAYGKAIATRKDNNNDYLNRAFVRLAREDFQGAAADVDRHLSAVPGSDRGLHIKGVLALQAGRYAEAQTLLEESLSKGPGFVRTLLFLGITAFLQQNYEQAERYLDSYLKYDPDSGTARTRLAVIHARQRRYAQAQSVLEPYLEMAPEDSSALAIMAELLLAQGKIDEGAAILDRIVALNPQSGSAQTQLGMSLLRLGEPERGLAALQAARALNPDLLQLNTLLALGLLQAGRADEALALAQEWQARNPDSAERLSLLGLVLAKRNRRDEANAAFERALQLDPGEPLAAGQLAAEARAAGQPERARALYEAVLQRNPTHLETLLAAAELEERQGVSDAAEKRLQQALKLYPNALPPRLALAHFHLRRQQPRRALELLDKIPGAFRDEPAVLKVLGQAQLADGQTGNAIATFQQWVGRQPQSAQARFMLGRAYEVQGNVALARSSLEEAMERDPWNLSANVAQIRYLVQTGREAEADALMDRLKQAYPGHPELLAQDGWIAYRQERFVDAARLFAETLPKLPFPNSRIAVYLAQSYWQAGEHGKAVEFLEDWLKRYPSERLARLALADLYSQAEQPDAARAAYAAVLEQSPDDLMALNNLANLLRERDPAQAQHYAEQAQQRNPDAPAVLDTLGLLRLDAGRLDEALRLLQRAGERAPHHPTIQYHLALALSKLGRTDEAQTVLNRLLANNRPFPEAGEARALLESLGR